MKRDNTWLKAYCGDVKKGCRRVPDESVDLVVTSPPYASKHGYSIELMRATGNVLARVLKPGGRAFMNFGQLKEGLQRPFEAHAELERGSKLPPHTSERWLHPQQTIIWVKSAAVGGWENKCECGNKWKEPITQRGHYQPLNSDQLLNYCFEYVFTYVKGVQSIAPLNRLGIGVPFTDQSNLKRGGRGKHGNLHCAGDVWFVPYDTTGPSKKKRHGHAFPLELVRRCIVLSGVPEGSVVFDPFMGGATTAIAARLCGMNAYSYDIDKESLRAGIERWKEYRGERWRLDGAQ